MEKFIPYEKLSKKQKRKIDAAKRTTWGGLNPVTRKPLSSKAYNRKKAQNWKKELPNSVPLFLPLRGYRLAILLTHTESKQAWILHGICVLVLFLLHLVDLFYVLFDALTIEVPSFIA